jgi:penicillin amidase
MRFSSYLQTSRRVGWISPRAIRSEVFGTNYLYADVDGHIGWHSAGLAPVRSHHDGLLPAPGDGSFAWTGMLPLDLLPSEFDPDRGFPSKAQ